MNPGNFRRLERIIGLALVCLLVFGCVKVMQPFITALLWAAVLCSSTWPLHRRVLALTGSRQTLAASLMTLAMVLVVLMPFLTVGLSMAENVKELTAATRSWLEEGPPQAPEWLSTLPGVGRAAADYWTSLASDSAKLLEAAKRLLEPTSTALLRGGLALGRGVLELALSIFIAFFFFRNGADLASRLARAVERLGGPQGMRLLDAAGSTVRSVVYGILGTALAQALLAGIGFLIAGVPGAALLALLTFFLCVLPAIGAPFVWVPAVIWLFHQGSTGWAIFLLVWGLGVSSMDNVLKPWLISQGSKMPFLLIFFGVLGGALAFGFIGFFLGPTLLATGFRLVDEWVTADRDTVQMDSSKRSSSTSVL